MGKPAARLGDSTAHGGVIVAGAPTVLICGMPAARLSDMTTCPMAVPAPTPIPHVGGPITLGSAGVLICGMPAARMGDQALCPPMGPAPIVVGAPTVLIGETGGGGGGGGAPGQAGGGGSQGTAESDSGEDPGEGDSFSGSGQSEGPEGREVEDHFLDVSFVDKGGHPITGVRYDYTGPGDATGRGWVNGGLRESGVESGNYDIKLTAITGASWSVARAKVGEEVRLQVETAGVESGTFAKLEIFMRDSNRADEVIHTIETQVDGDKIDEAWTFDVNDALLEYQDRIMEKGGYSNPFYAFKVTIGSLSTWSSLLQLRDTLEVHLKDDEDNALASREYRIFFPNGEIRPGKTDGDGVAKEDDVPPGRFFVSLDVRE